jgi:flagellar motor switch protein FliM
MRPKIGIKIIKEPAILSQEEINELLITTDDAKDKKKFFQKKKLKIY